MSVAQRLTDWLRTQLPDADDVRVEGLDRIEFGHSAEMMVLTVVTHRGSAEDRQDVVLRLRPRPPALLEPYDLARQFTVLRALEGTAVRVPPALWLEDSGDVLGRPFFVMERVAGSVYEMEAPKEPDVAPDGVKRMCVSMAAQIAAIHSVDLVAVHVVVHGRAMLTSTAGHRCICTATAPTKRAWTLTSASTGGAHCRHCSTAGWCARSVSPRRRRAGSAPGGSISRGPGRQGNDALRAHRRRTVPIVRGVLMDRSRIDRGDGATMATDRRVPGSHGEHDTSDRRPRFRRAARGATARRMTKEN